MNVLFTAAAFTFGLQFSAFCVAAVLQTEVFYDILGGFNFLALAWLGYPSENVPLLVKCMTFLFCISRGWLLVFLAWRAHSRKGDSRFDNVKNNPPLFLVYWMVQACWVYLISAPLMVVQFEAANATNTPTERLSTCHVLLLLGFAAAIVMEISSDIQKTLWVERGRNGGFCTIGWWQYSRHPNYAGEILQWWSAALLAVLSWDFGNNASSLLLPWISLVSPLFTMQILLTMSGTGVWNAEGKNLKRYYDNKDVRARYIEYRRTTPPVFPVLGYGSVPLQVKRILCFEWKRYEYKDK
jgi:steroid 5-alpha reductase family enzyme